MARGFGLCFQDEVGITKPIDPEALADLFSLVKDNVRSVILNACYSKDQANAISRHVPYTIGMNRSISDGAAIAFAIGFYQAIGVGKSAEEAYQVGCVQVGLQGFGIENSIPEIISN